ncbi:hypothetical protein LSTR_LSTR008519 [Laodelphax striatellus]|uniref:Uncharacterized protein n=1 Tax=Laodelphax striatellus TaxID=195883 RepID=A0A482WQQ9_LAOST|nr:hypothetical protein LSTR_LSTR008519 [Laodelphax striatellus]
MEIARQRNGAANEEINERSSDAEQSRGIRRTFTVGDKKGGEDSWDHPSSGNRFRSTCSCLQHFRIRSFAGARSKSNDELADEVDREEEREVAARRKEKWPLAAADN